MAASPTHCSTHEHGLKVKLRSGNKKQDMEVKAQLITGPELQSSMEGKQRAERMVELQERRRNLQALLSTRMAELRRVCLQEAELTGELPGDFPLETGGKPPPVRRRVGLAHTGSKLSSKIEEEDAVQRRSKNTLFNSALRRNADVDQQTCPGKRTTVHRGCHTDNATRSESSSMSDSTNQENEEVSERLSPSRPRVLPGSPDSRFCRKLSPVEIYYEMKTRRNSVSSSTSPSRTLPRSVSNLEGRSVPATPLLTRNGPGGVHISGTSAVKQRSDHPATSQALQDCLMEPSGGQARRSNSSDALLDRDLDEGGPAFRNGPYKSSETLLDGRSKQVNGHGEVMRVGSVSGGRSGNGSSGGYSEVLLDYVWMKQQKMHAQQQRLQAQSAVKPRAWHDAHPAPPPPYGNDFPAPQALILGPGPPAYSPLMLRGKPGEPRRVKVSRTKSCGPFIPVQQQQGYTEVPVTNGHAGGGQYPCRSRPSNYDPSTACTPQDDPTRSLHKALALEGLRDWYLRNAMGQTGGPCPAKGQETAAAQRRRTTASVHASRSHPALKHQPQSFQADNTHTHLPQSATFHGHPLHGRSDMSTQDTFSSKMQDLTLKETNSDRPSPGTLV